MSDTKRIAFTRAECLEIRRALELISQEDASADVNMSDEACRAKESAERKICRAMGWRSTFDPEPVVPSVDVVKFARTGKI